MLNQVVLVGRVSEQPKIEEREERKQASIKLAVQRSYKNEFGLYDCDFIPCILWNGLVENVCEYVKQGDLVGVKGRLQTQDDKLVLIAEKVSFLSSSKSED